MNLFEYFRSFFGPKTPDKSDIPVEVDHLAELFAIIYGRLPDPSERDRAMWLTSSLPQNDQRGIFRALINGYDHQQWATPFTVRFSESDLEYIVIQDFHLAIDKRDIAVSWPLLGGTYESHMLEFFNRTLKPGMVMIDVGANIGVYSMLAAQRVGSTGKVFCFEPNSENCRLIMLSICKNKFENVSVYPFALGNQTGHMLFSTHIGSNGGIIPNTQDSLINSNCVVVPGVRLDDVIDEKVDLIKLDVEGAEGLVLAGATRLIEEWRPIITSEFSLEMLARVSKVSGKDYLHYFKSHQYNLYLCERETFELVKIEDVDAFVDTYGDIGRLEDLALIPAEKS